MVKSTEVLVIVDDLNSDGETHRFWFENDYHGATYFYHVNGESELIQTQLVKSEVEELLDAVNFAIYHLEDSLTRSRATGVVLFQCDVNIYDRLWLERPANEVVFLCVWRVETGIFHRIWIKEEELGKFSHITRTALKWSVTEAEDTSQPDTPAETTPKEAVEELIEIGSTVQIREGIHVGWSAYGEVLAASQNGYTVKLPAGTQKFYALSNVRRPVQ